MGQTCSLYSQIEINASPEIVRSVLLDFERHKNWHATYVFKCLDPKIKPIDLKPGDKLDMEIRGYTLMGCPYPFRFQPTLRETPGGTTFIQSEEFTGLFAFLVGQIWAFGRQSLGHFRVLSQDLKTAAEQQANGFGAGIY
ncbi:unnamed protein product [Clonostachys solani]|uniref:Uncharacterized protein n=1 Tax=Clonostachys solani TaxID=160281 RepID=A0A9N9Z1Y3_9HYPO|nr:unnamed protein product [Clonostachys solani]